MTARERVLREAPEWSEATAVAVLSVVRAQTKLERWFEEESKLSDQELRQRDARRVEANARAAIREEPW